MRLQAVPVIVISEAIEVAALSMKSVLASYTLSLAVFIPISGWMADRFGTRQFFASAIGLFTLGSFVCGISSNIHLLVACRIMQGCGGAMMVPVGRLTLGGCSCLDEGGEPLISRHDAPSRHRLAVLRAAAPAGARAV
jgi:MFS family permease